MPVVEQTFPLCSFSGSLNPLQLVSFYEINQKQLIENDSRRSARSRRFRLRRRLRAVLTGGPTYPVEAGGHLLWAHSEKTPPSVSPRVWTLVPACQGSAATLITASLIITIVNIISFFAFDLTERVILKLLENRRFLTLLSTSSAPIVHYPCHGCCDCRYTIGSTKQSSANRNSSSKNKNSNPNLIISVADDPTIVSPVTDTTSSLSSCAFGRPCSHRN